MPAQHPDCCNCKRCNPRLHKKFAQRERESRSKRGTFNSTAFADKPQRNDPSVTNTYFNSGSEDGANHGHVKYRDNADGTTDYLYARDVEGNEYDV